MDCSIRVKSDLIIHRFDHRTPGTTHGHHTSSAQLGFEAFELSINPNSYPDQLKTLGIWQARRRSQTLQAIW